MQIARISDCKSRCVRIPRVFREVFHLFGGEEVTLVPLKEKNCLRIFMGPEPKPLTTLHRFKATVSDKVGASSTLYQAIESKSNVSIMSAQGTTTGRKSGAVGDLQSSAVGDLLLRVPQPSDNVEFLLSVLAESQDCTIKDFREHKPIESSLDLNDRTAAFRTHAYVRSAGKELEIPTSVLTLL